MNFLSIPLILVAFAVACSEAGVERCALTERAKTDTPCSYFLARSKEFRQMTLESFDLLNPHFDCAKSSNIIKAGTEVCLYAHSKFDADAMKDGEALQKFVATANRLGNKRRNSAYKQFASELQAILDGLNHARAKRDTQEAWKWKRELIMNMSDSNPQKKAFVGEVTKLTPELKALQDEAEKGRDVICAQLNKEPGSKRNEYIKCVCDNKDPYIYCQALLMRHEVEKNNYRGYPIKYKIPEEGKETSRSKRAVKCSDDGSGNKFLEKWNGKASSSSLNSFMKAGCQTVECLKNFCFSAECCVPIPKFPILSVCGEGGVCAPNPVIIGAKNMSLNIKHFEEARFFAKVGICLTDFGDIFSFLGLEKCFASIALEYKYIKSALSITPTIALIAVKASVSANVHFKALKTTNIILFNGTWVEDLCKSHDPELRCQEYCTERGVEASFSYSVDVWFFWWQNVAGGPLVSSYKCPPYNG